MKILLLSGPVCTAEHVAVQEAIETHEEDDREYFPWILDHRSLAAIVGLDVVQLLIIIEPERQRDAGQRRAS